MIGKVSVALVAISLLACTVLAGRSGWLPGQGASTMPVVQGAISQVVVATGRVEPLKEVVLANKIPGRIKSVLVREGDRVAAGVPVIVFDDEEYVTQIRMAEARIATAESEARRAQRALESARARWVEAKSPSRTQEVERARAELDQARQRHQIAELERQRSQRLAADGLIARAQDEATSSEAEVAHSRVRGAQESLSLLQAGPREETVHAFWVRVREAEAELERARNQVAQARVELEHARAVQRTTVVHSTIDGKVTRRMVEPGEAVDIGMPLMVLGNVNTIIVKAEVDETDVGKLGLGQVAEITAEAYPGQVFPGLVIEIGQSVGKRKIRPEDPVKIQDMKVLETKVEVTERADDLKLGMTVDVRILVVHKDNVVVVPRSLVPPGAREATIQVMGPDGARPRRITLGARDEERVEVVAGLERGERIVLPGRAALGWSKPDKSVKVP